MDFKKYIDQYLEEGVAVIPNFINKNQIAEVEKEIKKLINEYDFNSNKSVFSSSHTQSIDKFFIDSVDKISFFFEKDAFNEKNELAVPKDISINKIGHCLHMKNETFKKITFDEKVKNVVKQLGYKKPVVPQSMFIFKNSKIGGIVVPHKDGSFLFTKPDINLVGFWIPMVDVNVKNGCLYYVPKSHLISKRKFFVRNEDNSKTNFINENDDIVYKDEDFIPIEVEAGSCVLIHGLVVHKSEKNTTDHPRPIYTFHLLDVFEKEWDKTNWLQETENYKFPLLYEN